MDIKKILILAIFVIAIVGIIAPVSAAVESTDTKDKSHSDINKKII